VVWRPSSSMNGNKGGVDLCLGGLHHIRSLSGEVPH
jgi:hypothetical protein